MEESLPFIDRVVVIAAGGGVIADGAPHVVFDRDRDRLAALGVWVPGPAPTVPRECVKKQPVRSVLEELAEIAAAFPSNPDAPSDGAAQHDRSYRRPADHGGRGVRVDGHSWWSPKN